MKTDGVCVQFAVSAQSKKFSKKSIFYLAFADHPSMKSNYVFSLGKAGISMDRNSVQVRQNKVLDLSFSHKDKAKHFAQIAPLQNGGLRVEYGVRVKEERFPLITFEDMNPLNAVRLFSFSTNKNGLLRIDGIQKCAVVVPKDDVTTEIPTSKPTRLPTREFIGKPTNKPTKKPSSDEGSEHTFSYISKKPYFAPSPFEAIDNGNSAICVTFEACGAKTFYIALQSKKKSSAFRKTAYSVGIGLKNGKKNNVFVNGKSVFSVQATSGVSSAVERCETFDSYQVQIVNKKILELSRNGNVIMVHTTKFKESVNYLSAALSQRGKELRLRNVRAC